jgi:hypothetical protein
LGGRRGYGGGSGGFYLRKSALAPLGPDLKVGIFSAARYFQEKGEFEGTLNFAVVNVFREQQEAGS